MNIKDWLDSKVRILETTIKHKEEKLLKNDQENLAWVNGKIKGMQEELANCTLKNPVIAKEYQDEQHLLIDKYLRERDDCELRIAKTERDLAELYNQMMLYKIELINVNVSAL